MRVRSVLRAVVAAALLVGVTAAPAGAEPPGTVGAPGVGDSLFPLAGNGGIDVQDYNLRLAYDPGTRKLDGTATLRIVATQNLSRFDLDLREFTLGVVTVDGAPARIPRSGQELQITPQRLIRKGAAFTVVVPYSGVPKVVVDADGSSEGFVPTRDGAVVVNEPQGSPGWYPANDTPRDKATYTVAMTVPNGLTAVGNGSLLSQTAAGGRTTFTWRERFPMAPYLTTITLGRFAVATGRTGSGIPTYVAVDPTQAAKAAPVLRQLPDMVGFLEDLYGRYPFETVGAIVDNAPDLGYALETQTKPVFDSAPDELTLLHELSHQWYGDAVTLRGLEGHLAARGLRDLVGVDLDRAARRQARRAAARRAVRDPRRRRGVLEPAAGRPRRAGFALRRHDLRPRRHDAAGAAGEDRRARLPHRDAPLVRRAQVRQRLHAGVRGARPAGVGPEPRRVLHGAPERSCCVAVVMTPGTQQDPRLGGVSRGASWPSSVHGR